MGSQGIEQQTPRVRLTRRGRAVVWGLALGAAAGVGIGAKAMIDANAEGKKCVPTGVTFTLGVLGERGQADSINAHLAELYPGQDNRVRASCTRIGNGIEGPAKPGPIEVYAPAHSVRR